MAETKWKAVSVGREYAFIKSGREKWHGVGVVTRRKRENIVNTFLNQTPYLVCIYLILGLPW